MAKRISDRALLGQNFLRSAGLVRRLLELSTIGPADVVYEIGAGRGRITAELARLAARVIAIEKDAALAGGLRARFQNAPNLKIVEADYLGYRIREPVYKVFANIPYGLTARIVRKLLYAPPMPADAYLVMQAEAARKFAGCPHETEFSVLAKPFWRPEILCTLRRTDFEPVPRVDSVLVRFERRAAPLIDPRDIGLYRAFVQCGFRGWRKSLKLNFKRVFSYPQWKHLARELQFSRDAIPSELRFEQWLGLFACFRNRNQASTRMPLRDTRPRG